MMWLINGDCLEELKKLEERYLICPLGIIFNKKTERVVKFPKDYKGYFKTRLHTSLSKNKDGRKPYRLHRLIAMKFLKTFKKDLQVNHKNGIKTDNCLNNLEMVTNSENAKHGWLLESNKNRINKLNRDATGKFIKN